MDSNPLLSALQSNYGDGSPPPPDTSTVRGLLTFCKMWLDRETETRHLNNPCMEMAGRLKAGAMATEKDLRQNPNLVESARAPIERSAEAYWTIAEILDKLPQLAAEEDVEAYEDAIDLFEHERQVVLDCTAEIEKSLSGEIRLCPRCGDQGEDDICDSCQLVRLYPDPKATEYDRSKTAILSPIYGEVNEAYDAVMSGVQSLPSLYPVLNKLEDELVELQDGYQQAMDAEISDEDDPQHFKDSKELAKRLLGELDRTFDGIDRMRSVEENFKMANLSRGWDTIFDAAVDIKRATMRYAKNQGLLDGFQDDSDSIQLSGN